MQDAAAQFAAIKAVSTRQYNISVRQITGGTIVAGQVTYVDNATGGALAQQTFEGVALSPDEAGAMVATFLTYGDFKKPAEPMPLFTHDPFATPPAPVDGE